jgi:hypothetical protein
MTPTPPPRVTPTPHPRATAHPRVTPTPQPPPSAASRYRPTFPKFRHSSFPWTAMIAKTFFLTKEKHAIRVQILRDHDGGERQPCQGGS